MATMGEKGAVIAEAFP